MDVRAGYAYVIWIDDATGAPVVLAGQTDITIDGGNNLLDVSGKEDFPDKEFIGGWLDDKLTLTTAYLPSDASYSVLDAARKAGTKVHVTGYLAGTAVEEADALVASLNRTHPIEGKATATITLQITGGWSAA